MSSTVPVLLSALIHAVKNDLQRLDPLLTLSNGTTRSYLPLSLRSLPLTIILTFHTSLNTLLYSFTDVKRTRKRYPFSPPLSPSLILSKEPDRDVFHEFHPNSLSLHFTSLSLSLPPFPSSFFYTQNYSTDYYSLLD